MRFEGKLKSEGITDAVEVLFEDTGKLRSRIYLVLAEVDPLFEINDGEYRMLLDDRGFCLPDVLREILRILDMGAVSPWRATQLTLLQYAIPISMWHNLSGAKSDSGVSDRSAKSGMDADQQLERSPQATSPCSCGNHYSRSH